MRLRKSIISIGKTPCTVVKVNYNLPKVKLAAKDRMHFIQILDRSDSMKPNIEELIENVKQTTKIMKDTDIISVIWFSGHGEYATLLKGANPNDPCLFSLLDTLKSTMGSTFFSEALLEAKSVAQELITLSDKIIVSLFTDGDFSSSSKSEEKERAKKILSEFGDKLLAFNTIGYGSHYDIKFLKELSALSKFGRHTHSSKIKEYSSIIKATISSLRTLTDTKLYISSDSANILFITNSISKKTTNTITVNLSDSRENKVYLINSDDTDFVFNVDSEAFDSSKIKGALSENEIKEFLYYLSYEEYYIGNSFKALDIMTTSLKDKYITRIIKNAFTRNERQHCINILLKAAQNKKLRTNSNTWVKARLMEGELITKELVEPEVCIMELLGEFTKNGDKFIPESKESYKRIGKKVEDHFNMFKVDDSAITYGNFNDLVFNKERLNVSIRYKIPGFLIINPKQAKSVGFQSNKIKANIYREQTIIKDCELNMSRMKILCSKRTLKYIEKLSINDFYTIIDGYKYSIEGYTPIELNIEKLPLITKEFAAYTDSLDEILRICFLQRLAECKQKVIKYFLKSCPSKSANTNNTSQYTGAQRSLLEDYGLSIDGIYQGIDKQAQPGIDKYEYKSFIMSLKGFSTLPSVENLIKKIEAGKILNAPESLMKEYINYIIENKINLSHERLYDLLKRDKEAAAAYTKILAIVKLARTLHGGWWKGLILDSKGNYLYEKDGKTLVIKVTKKESVI